MKKNKKIYLILAIISLFICIYTTSKTYAKYFTQTDNYKEYNIKKWNFKINNDDVKNNQELKQDITVEIEPSEHVAENQLAPDSTGHFIINLDYTNVDLSFDYELEIDKNDELKDINIEKIEVDGTPYMATENRVSNSIIIDDTTTERTKEVTVYIKWNDGEGSVMSNKEDTDIAINNESINFKLNISLTQKN